MSKDFVMDAYTLSKNWKKFGEEWMRPFGNSQYLDVVKNCSAWVDMYIASVIPNEGESPLDTLGDETFKLLERVGIKVMHTNPIRLAGGIRENGTITESVDGGYDRISYSISPEYGSDDSYKDMVTIAGKYGISIADDIIPGHTGKGLDWILATKNHDDYPTIYHMVEIRKENWDLLPDVPEEQDVVNLNREEVTRLRKEKYIVGNSKHVIFYQKGVKETNWSVTKIIKGFDGIERRWVYLHIFKDGQPSLNWLHPSFRAQRLIAGDIVKSINYYGAKLLRLDATPFLGIEINPNSDDCIIEGHPLATVATETMAMLIRKAGGWSYEENDVTLDILQNNLKFGPELSYDFNTRAGYVNALLSGDTSLMKLELELLIDYKIDLRRLIHSLQNHDDVYTINKHINLNPNTEFNFKGTTYTGRQITDYIFNLTKVKAKEYDLQLFDGSGIATTFASICLGRLGISRQSTLSKDQLENVKKLMLLISVYNAYLPGIFQISAWDLMGALQLEKDDPDIQNFTKGFDYRWLDRGAYDLTGNSTLNKSVKGVPKCKALFGDLRSQLNVSDSFVSQLQRLLKLRIDLDIPSSIFLGTLPSTNSTIVFVNRNSYADFIMVILNFGENEQVLNIPIEVELMPTKEIIDVQTEEVIIMNNNEIVIPMSAYDYKIIKFSRSIEEEGS